MSKRTHEIRARLDLLEWGDEHQQASVVDAIPADLRALLAVVEAAEVCSQLVVSSGGDWFQKYLTLVDKVRALDSEEQA